MDNDEMLEASEWEGFRWLSEAGWHVSVSQRLWDRYVRVPDQADDECETVRYREMVSRLRTVLLAATIHEPTPWGAVGFRMEALLNDPAKEGDAVLVTVEVAVYPVIDSYQAPRLLIILEKESFPSRGSLKPLPH